MLRVTAIALLVVAAFAAAAPVYAAVGACDPHACCKKAHATKLTAGGECCPPAACVRSTNTANQPNGQFEIVPQRQAAKLDAITPSVIVLVTNTARPAIDSEVAAPPPSSRARLAQLATLLI